jgi:hypothetical protein
VVRRDLSRIKDLSSLYVCDIGKFIARNDEYAQKQMRVAQIIFGWDAYKIFPMVTLIFL